MIVKTSIFGLIPEFLGLDCDGKKADEILKIIGIYVGNNFETGLSIQFSCCNHSCKPNAVNSEFNGVWAVCSIKEGQEIIISYKEDG